MPDNINWKAKCQLLLGILEELKPKAGDGYIPGVNCYCVRCASPENPKVSLPFEVYCEDCWGKP